MEQDLKLMASETHYVINTAFGTSYAVELLVSQDLNQDVLSLSRYVLDINVYRGEVNGELVMVDQDRPDKVMSEHTDCTCLNNLVARNQRCQIYEVSKVDNIAETFSENELDPGSTKPYDVIATFAVTFAVANEGSNEWQLVQDRALMIQLGERNTVDPINNTGTVDLGVMLSVYNLADNGDRVGIKQLMHLFRKFVKVLPKLLA